MKKIFLYGLLVGLISLILGMAVSYLFMLFPSVAADYSNPAIMRSWSDPLMMLFFVYPFIQGIIWAWAWDRTKGLFRGTTSNRGANFGLAIWLVATIPGMFVTYTSMPYGLMTVISWTVGGLINAVVGGLVLAKLNK